MKITIASLLTLLAIAANSTASAGGAQASYREQGLPLLNQAPALAKALSAAMSIKDRGVFGPMDAPFEGRRLYTHIDFRGTSFEGGKQSFLIRIHFTREPGEFKFSRLEILPVPAPIDIKVATFKELQQATGIDSPD